MDSLTLLTSRASAIKLQEPAPAGAELEKILSAAVRAPDHGRLQPWRFLVIEGEARQRFGELLADALRRREPSVLPAQLEAERKKPLRAPLILVVAAVLRSNPKVPDIEQVISAGAAAHGILLAAEALGYGGFWRTGGPAYDPQVKRGLGLAEADHIVGFLYLGTVAVPGRPRDIDPAAFVSRWQ